MTRAQLSAIIIHIVAWLLFMSFPILFMNQGKDFQTAITAVSSWVYIQFCVFYVVIFYLNGSYLFPKLYFKKKYLVYCLSLLTLLFLTLTLKPFDGLIQKNSESDRAERPPQHRQQTTPPLDGMYKAEENHPAPPPGGNRGAYCFDLNSLIIFLMVMGIGIALRTIKEWQLTEKRAILAEAERANAELSFLKAQINPHFLYNTLNNIYTLCITGSENAAESIMKLSNIMRYVTDEAEADFVPLQGEIDCIENFIDLQKLRLGKKVSLVYEVKGETAGHTISPLILMTFIENVFKYGLSNHTETQITIKINVEGDKISFFAQNSIFENKGSIDRKGLGISNTRQRLEHLYPDRYVLDIDDQNRLFTVQLTLHS